MAHPGVNDLNFEPYIPTASLMDALVALMQQQVFACFCVCVFIFSTCVVVPFLLLDTCVYFDVFFFFFASYLCLF